MKITSRKIKGFNHLKYTWLPRLSIQASKITIIGILRIFDPEEKKVDTIDDNIPPWVEVDEDLEGIEAP